MTHGGGSKFEIDSSTGQIIVTDKVERQEEYFISVVATDFVPNFDTISTPR